MRQNSQHFLRTIFGTTACLLALHTASAQGLAIDRVAQADSPARWYQEDTTPQARFRTLKKEAGAAQQEALSECKKLEYATRSACIKKARATFELDLDDARQQMKRPYR